MRRVILVSILLSVSSTLTEMVAQNWETIGSKWYYSEWQYPFRNFSTIEVIGDTILNGQDCQIIAGSCTCGIISPKYMYEDSNRVYWYDEYSLSFHLLYDFNKTEGESWDLVFIRGETRELDTAQIMVDSISYLSINGDTLSVQHTRASTGWIWLGKVIEGIGSEMCMFPQNGLCGPPSGPIRCFENMITGTYHFQDDIPCDTIINVVSTDELIDQEEFTIFPNPIVDQINISYSGNSNRALVQIFSYTGQLVISQDLLGRNEHQLRLSSLVSGVYLIKLITAEGHLRAKVFIKK